MSLMCGCPDDSKREACTCQCHGEGQADVPAEHRICNIIELSEAQKAKMMDLIENPPAPGAALIALLGGKGKAKAKPLDIYEAKLRALATEMREGRGNAAYANELRNELSPLWMSLSEADQELVDDLSDRLFTDSRALLVPIKNDLLDLGIKAIGGGAPLVYDERKPDATRQFFAVVDETGSVVAQTGAPFDAVSADAARAEVIATFGEEAMAAWRVVPLTPALSHEYEALAPAHPDGEDPAQNTGHRFSKPFARKMIKDPSWS